MVEVKVKMMDTGVEVEVSQLKARKRSLKKSIHHQERKDRKAKIRKAKTRKERQKGRLCALTVDTVVQYTLTSRN